MFMIDISFGKMAPLSEEFRPRAMTLPSKQKQHGFLPIEACSGAALISQGMAVLQFNGRNLLCYFSFAVCHHSFFRNSVCGTSVCHKSVFCTSVWCTIVCCTIVYLTIVFSTSVWSRLWLRGGGGVHRNSFCRHSVCCNSV